MDNNFLSQVERDLLEHIASGLKANNISVDDSQQLAKDFLASLPAKDKEDLLNKLNELGKVYAPAQQAYVDFIGEVAEEKRDQLLNSMRDHIRNGNIDAALEVAKKGNTE